jgi:predicted NBD/HSP70 family sugar kinase
MTGAGAILVADFFEPAERGVQHASLRAANRRAVLTAIAFNAGISNAEVSRRTGLAPQTASAIVSELETEGLITRGDVLRGRRGQPATPLHLNRCGAFGIGCEISWRHLDVVLVNLVGEEVGRRRLDFVYPDAATVVAQAVAEINAVIALLPEDRRARIAGIGIASPTNFSRRIVDIGAPNEQVASWDELDLRAAIEAATGMPSIWVNDGNAACFSAMLFTPPPRPPNLVHLYVSTFLGAGITAQHALSEGPTGNAANLGSMLVVGADGAQHVAAEIASAQGLRRHLQEAGLKPLIGNPENWPWAEWEPQVSQWIDNAGSALAQVIFNTGAVVEIDRVIIDGKFPREIIARLLQATERGLDKLAGFHPRRPPLVAGILGERAVSLGAAQIHLYRKFLSRDLSDMLGDEA